MTAPCALAFREHFSAGANGDSPCRAPTLLYNLGVIGVACAWAKLLKLDNGGELFMVIMLFSSVGAVATSIASPHLVLSGKNNCAFVLP